MTDDTQVVDEFGGKGNVLNFNVGDGMKFALPNVFWTRLTGKYGTVSNTICDWMIFAAKSMNQNAHI